MTYTIKNDSPKRNEPKNGIINTHKRAEKDYFLAWPDFESDEADRYFHDGQIFESRKMYREALEAYAKSLRVEYHKTTHFYIGLALMNHGLSTLDPTKIQGGRMILNRVPDHPMVVLR